MFGNVGMAFLLIGVCLWFLTHISPSILGGKRQQLVYMLGKGTYRGIFTVLILLSLALIVIGWRASVPTPMYEPPNWGRHLNWLLMPAALILFVSGFFRTNLKRLMRHPQLVSVAIWSVGHLLSNGDARSLVLFGGIGTWALLSIVTINRRDGRWRKPHPVPWVKDLATVGIGTVIYVLTLFAHPYLSGVSVVGA